MNDTEPTEQRWDRTKGKPIEIHDSLGAWINVLSMIGEQANKKVPDLAATLPTMPWPPSEDPEFVSLLLAQSLEFLAVMDDIVDVRDAIASGLNGLEDQIRKSVARGDLPAVQPFIGLGAEPDPSLIENEGPGED